MAGLFGALDRRVFIIIPARAAEPSARLIPALKLAYCQSGRGDGMVTMHRPA